MNTDITAQCVLLRSIQHDAEPIVIQRKSRKDEYTYLVHISSRTAEQVSFIFVTKFIRLILFLRNMNLWTKIKIIRLKLKSIR